jgi:AcrR family transcriptional regulator
VTTILNVASALLDEVGFDRLTTNLICSRAGLTPPALYRHFPNKYGVVEELGRRLMEAQNSALYAFLEEQTDLYLTPQAIATILRGQLGVTFAVPGGRWIMRSLHSTPALVHLRLNSHQSVVDDLITRHLSMQPAEPTDRMRRRYWIAVDTSYAIMELLLDRPELDVESITADAGEMIARLLADIDN